MGSYVLLPESKIYQQLKIQNEKILAAMLPNNCVTHLEMFKLRDGRLVFVEIAARAPGLGCSEMHERQWGVNLRLLHMKCQLNIQPHIVIEKSDRYHAWAHVPLSNGQVKEINMPEISSHVEANWLIEVGDCFHEDYFNQGESLMLSNIICCLHYDIQ